MSGLEDVNLEFNLNPCGSFYEKETGKSFVEMNMPFQKESEELFEFEYEFTDCDQFKMEPDIKMELFYGELRKFSFGSFQKNGNRITIDKSVLKFIELEEEFLLCATASFSTNGATQELSIIFKMKYAVDIVLDTWPDVIGVQQGSDLIIDASSAALVNSQID